MIFKIDTFVDFRVDLLLNPYAEFPINRDKFPNAKLLESEFIV